jgi:hypothetical protein
MIRRSLACLAVLAACGPAAPKPPAAGPGATQATPTASPTPTAAPAPAMPAMPAADGEVTRWTAKLDDPRESEQAVAKLEELGDRRAIPRLGTAWQQQGRPVRMLQVVIALAKPLTPQEAAAKFLTAYEKTGRPASWDAALPFLQQAIVEVDEANPRSVDSATKAADAIGEARLAAGLPALSELARKPPAKKLVVAQVAAIRALGKLAGEKGRAALALVPIVDREPPPHPRQATDAERAMVGERFELALVTAGAAINALAELRAETATGALVLALYRLPELNIQIRRALVAGGPGAAAELRKVLRGQHDAVNQLVRTRHLDRYCGDRGDAPCQPVSAMDFYAAAALGAFHDAGAVPDLLAALKRPAAPAYYIDDAAGPLQHAAIFDALRTLGAPEAAPVLRALWRDPKQELALRIGAAGAYAFAVRDATGTDELGAIAADNRAEDELRQEAAVAYARLARDRRAITLLQELAKRYLDASAKKRQEADRAKPRADAADKELDAAKQKVDAAKTDLLRMTKDPTASADQIRAATAATKQLEADLKTAKQAHREKVRPFKETNLAATAYLGYARMFQMHIARVEIAMRCKEDLACYATSLRLTPEQAAKNVSPYIADVFSWKPDETRGLIAAAADRALLEIGKRGAAAQELAPVLLIELATEDRTIRQGILRALPLIAKLPCPTCVEKLDLAIQAAEGKTTLRELTAETTLLRNYFVWAGTK